LFPDLHPEQLLQTLTKVTDEVLDGICTITGAKFLELGLELGLKEEEINSIEFQLKGCQAITRRILKSWIQERGPNATWMALGDALYEIKAGVDFIKEACCKQKCNIIYSRTNDAA